MTKSTILLVEKSLKNITGSVKNVKVVWGALVGLSSLGTSVGRDTIAANVVELQSAAELLKEYAGVLLEQANTLSTERELEGNCENGHDSDAREEEHRGSDIA